MKHDRSLWDWGISKNEHWWVCGELLHVHFHVHASNLFNVHAFRLFSTVYFWLIVTSVTSSKCCIVGKCHVHQSQVNMSNHEHQTCCNEHKPYQFSNLTLLQKVFRPKTTPTRWLFRTQLLTCKPGLSRFLLLIVNTHDQRSYFASSMTCPIIPMKWISLLPPITFVWCAITWNMYEPSSGFVWHPRWSN